MQAETFVQFKQRVDHYVISVSGMGADDFADAPWYDLYEDYCDVFGREFELAVEETLSEADDIFAAILGNRDA